MKMIILDISDPTFLSPLLFSPTASIYLFFGVTELSFLVELSCFNSYIPKDINSFFVTVENGCGVI